MRALLLSLVLAGCLAPALPASVAASEPPALELLGCSNLSGSFPVLASDARPLLPNGFQPRSAETSLHSVFWIVSVQCEGSRVAGVDGGPASFSYGELDVLPPNSQKLPDVADHTIPLFSLAQPQAVVDALVGLGLPNVALATATPEELPGGAKRVGIDSDIGSFEMTGVPTGTAPTELGEASWGMFGLDGRSVASRILGHASGGTATQSALTQTSEGSLPLMSNARPLTRGGMVDGFDLSFSRVS